MNSSTTSIKFALIGIDDTEVAVRKGAFLELTEADALDCCIRLPADARRTGSARPQQQIFSSASLGCSAKRSSEGLRPRPI